MSDRLLERLAPCRNKLCDRRVRVGVLYCCRPCASADSRGYEIHDIGHLAHSCGCDERARARKETAR